jgi:hypothetical protein
VGVWLALVAFRLRVAVLFERQKDQPERIA